MIKRVLLSIFFMGTGQAMVFDNRFFPFLLKPSILRTCAPDQVTVQPFFMMADSAFSEGSGLTIPDMCGIYDQRVLAQTFPLLEKSDPLRSDFQLRTSIPWVRKGRIDAQGLALRFEHAVHDSVDIGFNTLFMHAAVRHEFLFSDAEAQLPLGDKNYLLQSKEQINRTLGLTPALFSKTGFGDIDAYLKFHWGWDYVLKCRRIDVAFKPGILIPTAQERDCDNPASVPFGGNCHWGAYLAVEAEWELKENLTLGLMGRVSKRFKRSFVTSVPLLTEPVEYGALKAPILYDPGWTFVFNPSVRLEEVREGLGFEVLYSLIVHREDSVFDGRTSNEKKVLPAQSSALESCSSWGSEYASIGAFYDFGKGWGGIRPKLSAYWDIPVGWLVSKRAAKTNGVSLMVDVEF